MASTSNSFIFPTSGLGFARNACSALYNASSGLVTASYEAGSIYSYVPSQVTPALVPVATSSGSINTYIDCSQDGGSGFYVLARSALVHVPFVPINPALVTVLNLPTSPSFVYTGLVYNTTNNIPYFIGYDGTIYQYTSSTVSKVTNPPGGITAPARQLVSNGSNLFTLFENSNVVGSYSIAGSGWTEITLPFAKQADVIHYSSNLNKLIAGGRNYLDLHTSSISDITYALTPDQLAIAQSSNNIAFYNFNNGEWTLAQNVTGTGHPVNIAAEPDGNQVLVTDTTNNLVQVLTNTAGNWSQTSTVSLTAPTNLTIYQYDESFTQALVCQPSQNQISILNKSVLAWAVVQTITITDPTAVAVVSNATATNAIVSTSAGVTLLNFNGSLWEITDSVALSPIPTQVAADYVNTNNPYLYAAGSTGGNTTVSIFNASSKVGQYSGTGSLGQLAVANYQVFIPTSAGNLNGGAFVPSMTQNAVVSGVTVPASGVATVWIPEVVDFFPSLLIANSTDVWTFYNDKPQSLSRTTDSFVAIYSGTGSLWSTIDLVDSNPISSIVADNFGNIYASTVSNYIYKIVSQTTIASGYPYILIPPPNQEEGVNLGLSKLLYWNNSLYSSSSLMGGLSIITNL